MSFELDSKTIGEVTEAVVDRKFAKAAGVIAGALVGGGAALAGLGPAAVVPAAITKKLVESLASRLSETNTEKMLATYRSITERQEFIQTITREVVFELQKPSVTQRDAIGDLSSNVDAWFAQIFKYLQSQDRGPVPFASAADIEVIPPNLDGEVVLPDHLKGYLERRLGVAKQRTKVGKEDDRKRATARDHDTWRESIRQHELEFEDHPEDQVLRELVAAASQSTPQKLWMIQGEPGSGKSTLVEHWVEHWVAGLDGEPKDGVLLPVLVRFRDLPEAPLPASGSELAELLWSHAFVGELGTRYPKLYAESRRVMSVPVWFLDGWDEARLDDCRTDSFLDHLRKLPGLKVLTCRTAVLATIRQPTKVDSHLQANGLYTLRDLDQKEQLVFLNRRLTKYPKEAELLHKTLQCQTQLRAISSSPLLLGLIADMAVREFVRGLEVHVPGSRSAFYRSAIEHAWTEKLQGLGATDEDAKLRDDTLTGLASNMRLENITIESSALIETMKAVPDLQTREQRERLLGFLVKSGLLRSPQTGVYEFVHLTFQEYYLAHWLLQVGFEQALYTHWADPRYDEVLALMVSQLVECREASTVEDVLIKFVEWGQEKYKKEPEYLLRTVKRSPLRVTLHLVNRVGLPSHSSPNLVRILTNKVLISNVRKVAISHDKSAPADILKVLARDADVDVRRNIAGNSNTPADILKVLARDADVDVRRNIARNSNTPAETLAELAMDKEWNVSSRVAGNSNAPAHTLRDLAKDLDCATMVAHNPNTSKETLVELAKCEDELVRATVAFNPNTPTKTLEKLVLDDGVRWSLPFVSCTRIPKKIITEVALDDASRFWIASSIYTSACRLAELAENDDFYVRILVARNLNTPVDVLGKLAKDSVAISVAGNSNTPEETLRMLAMAEDVDLRCAVARNSNTPEETLTELAMAEDVYVRCAVAGNSNTPKETLRMLAMNGDVQWRVAGNSNTPEETLTELAMTEDVRVRLEVCGNSNTPEETLRMLAMAEDVNVRCAVAEHSNTPEETLTELAMAENNGMRTRISVAHNHNLILESV